MSITAILLIITAILWGSSPILEKVGLRKIDPLIAVTIRSIAVSTMLLVLMIFTGMIKELLNVDCKTIALFSISGVMAGFLGMRTYFGTLRMGATSKIAPIAATYPLVTAFLSIAILKEGLTIIRLIELFLLY